MCVEADAAVGVGAWRAVLQVAFDGAPHRGQLATYLVVTSRVELHLKQPVAVAAGYEAVAEVGAFRARAFRGVGVAFVLAFVPTEVVDEFPLLRRRFGADNGVVGLLHVARAEEVVHAREGFARSTEHAYTTDGAVQSVGHAQKYRAWLTASFLDVGLGGIGQCGIARLIALHYLACRFVYYQQVVVFVEDVHGEVFLSGEFV